jgi:hypothetical protein
MLATAGLAFAAGGALAAPTYTSSVHIGYDPSAPTSNFAGPGPNAEFSGYTIHSGQDASNIYVRLVADDAAAVAGVNFANIYFGGNTSVGIEVANNRAFIPGGPGGVYYALAGTGFTYAVSPGEITFVLPWDFLLDDPLGMGFNTLSSAPGDNFTRISLSQSFGYAVAGGAGFGTERLGAFTVAVSEVPEPATLGLFLLSVAGLGAVSRRRGAASPAAPA